jgi:hypothetical protein
MKLRSLLIRCYVVLGIGRIIMAYDDDAEPPTKNMKLLRRQLQLEPNSTALQSPSPSVASATTNPTEATSGIATTATSYTTDFPTTVQPTMTPSAVVAPRPPTSHKPGIDVTVNDVPVEGGKPLELFITIVVVFGTQLAFMLVGLAIFTIIERCSGGGW